MRQRLRIGLDLDGVVYKFTDTYRYMMNKHRGVGMPPVEDFWYGWDAADQFTTEEDREWVWTEGIRLGLFRYGHLYKGAIEGVTALAEVAEVHVITSRPQAAVEDTLAFLAYTRLPLAGVNILSGGEAKSSIRPEFDIYIDDGLHNIVDLMDNTEADVLVFDQPWNRNSEDLGSNVEAWRVYGWEDTVAVVNFLVNQEVTA